VAHPVLATIMPKMVLEGIYALVHVYTLYGEILTRILVPTPTPATLHASQNPPPHSSRAEPPFKPSNSYHHPV